MKNDMMKHLRNIFFLETEFANEFKIGSTQKPAEDREVVDYNGVKQSCFFCRGFVFSLNTQTIHHFLTEICSLQLCF